MPYPTTGPFQFPMWGRPSPIYIPARPAHPLAQLMAGVGEGIMAYTKAKEERRRYEEEPERKKQLLEEEAYLGGILQGRPELEAQVPPEGSIRIGKHVLGPRPQPQPLTIGGYPGIFDPVKGTFKFAPVTQGPYKTGQIVTVKEGDKFVNYVFKQGQLIKTSEAPRYKQKMYINLPKQPPSKHIESLMGLYQFESQLGRIEENWEPMFTGPIQGRIGAIREIFGVDLGITEKKAIKEAVFRQTTKDISDTLLRLRSGAQINEQEYKRLLKLVPHANLPDRVFLARLGSLKKAITNTIGIRERVLRTLGYKPLRVDDPLGIGQWLQ